MLCCYLYSECDRWLKSDVEWTASARKYVIAGLALHLHPPVCLLRGLLFWKHTKICCSGFRVCKGNDQHMCKLLSITIKPVLLAFFPPVTKIMSFCQVKQQKSQKQIKKTFEPLPMSGSGGSRMRNDSSKPTKLKSLKWPDRVSPCQGLPRDGRRVSHRAKAFPGTAVACT